jgi:hypothetical protein
MDLEESGNVFLNLPAAGRGEPYPESADWALLAGASAPVDST